MKKLLFYKRNNEQREEATNREVDIFANYVTEDECPGFIKSSKKLNNSNKAVKLRIDKRHKEAFLEDKIQMANRN